MNGILCIDKPPAHTSFDVVARVRGILKTKKVGHGGTLDPMATGVLPVFVGAATKCCDILPDETKRYIATARLGLDTDTQDITGTVLQTGGAIPTRAELLSALEGFRGSYLQVPPMYSAVKIGGQRLYHLARKGLVVERPGRSAEILALSLLDFDEKENTFTLEAACSKGTYIRTLCCDIAQSLGALCTLTALRRTAASGFLESDCVSLETLQELAREGTAGRVLLPVARAFASLPRMTLTRQQAVFLKNGVKIDSLRTQTDCKRGRTAVYCEDGSFLAVGEIDEQDGILKRVKQFPEEN